jgi:hypothetical protein
MDLLPYTDSWPPDDRHANFKEDVAHYTVLDPMPTLEGLSAATGVPVPCLARYVLVKYAVSNADALLAMGPLLLHQMEQQIEKAEAINTADARLAAYEALKQMIRWLRAGMQS